MKTLEASTYINKQLEDMKLIGNIIASDWDFYPGLELDIEQATREVIAVVYDERWDNEQ